MCKELVDSTEPQVDFPSPTDPHIEGSGTSETDILFPTLIDISLQEESFLVVKKDRKKTKVIIREQSDIDLALETLNASDSEEEITEVEPESDDEDTILDYSAPDIENGDEEIFEDIENLDQDFGWILIWILRYQQRYRLADTATESLVKFMHFLLTDLNQNKFKNFPPSLYLARKLMGLGLYINNYATCSAYNRLYEPNKVITKKPGQILICFYCTFVEYPHYSMSKMRQPCNQQLAKEVSTKDRILYYLLFTYPTINIKNQLQLLYRKKGFKHHAERGLIEI